MEATPGRQAESAGDLAGDGPFLWRGARRGRRGGREPPREGDRWRRPAAELVREQRGHVGREADQLEHLYDALTDRRAREIGVDLQRLADDALHAHAGAQ